MKYLKGGSLRNITSSNTPLGTTIWNSCRRGIDKFKQQLYQTSGNGKKILLWDDKISGHPVVSSVLQLSDILDWSTNKGLLRLVDICAWDCAGNWVSWNFPDLPDCLVSQKSLLISLLSGLAPVHSSSKDSWVGAILVITQFPRAF